MPAPRNREQFAALVNEARRRQYLSIRAVAKVARVPATTVQGWLDGRHFPSPALRSNYVLLVSHLGLDDQVPDDLWDDSAPGSYGDAATAAAADVTDKVS